LVHEAFLQLAEHSGWNDRAHFLGVAAGVMREVLVDHARKRATAKRGGGRRRVELSSGLFEPVRRFDVLDLHEAMEALKALNGRQAQIVELRFFAGMTIQEAALFLDLSDSTVEADWRFARAWLSARLRDGFSA
jgi:RNA polymerase sigma factor (TIGR02999 family)